MPNKTMRQLLALPPRLGGIFFNLATMKHSINFKGDLRAINQDYSSTAGQRAGCTTAPEANKATEQAEHVGRANDLELNSNLSVEMQKCVSAAQKKGVSSWLSALSLTKLNMASHYIKAISVMRWR